MSLLRDKDYVELVKATIKDVLGKYVSSDSNIEDEDAHFDIDDQLLFEMIKLEIRGQSIAFGARKKKENKAKERELEKTIERCEQILSSNPLDRFTIERLDTSRQELVDARRENVLGAMIRSKARWVEAGEKPTRYFCGLEKRNFTTRTISHLDINGRITTDPGEIQREQALFYKKLYSAQTLDNSELSFFLNESNIKRLTEKNQALCEGMITENEIKQALKNMANGKSPGPDGYPAEFYKFFWGDLGRYYIKSLALSFEKGELSVTQKQGVITCLPKGNKPREFLKNWRPITLLNVDYKIASACLASRMKTVLPDIISESQKGFIKDRFIGENTRLTYDIMEYLNSHNKPGLLLLLDFEKAFDSIHWNYMERVLQKYNFGPTFSGRPFITIVLAA